MKIPSAMTTPGRIRRILLCCALCARAAAPWAAAGQPAAELQARYLSLQEQLSHNAFQRPLFLDSTETADALKGDIYAVLDHPYAAASLALQKMDHWCDILILHLNVKGCHALNNLTPPILKVSIGRKNDEPLEHAYPVDFEYQVATADETYLHVILHADAGPLGSKNYRIALEAVPLPAGGTFLHLSYSYEYGLAGRLAMKAYLATLGSAKVGFSVAGRRPDGGAILVDGVRGVAERNTMRYYLAVEAYLGSQSVPPTDQLEKRLHDWFAATERFTLQLHELNEDEYLAMKRKEVLRQQAGPGG